MLSKSAVSLASSDAPEASASAHPPRATAITAAATYRRRLNRKDATAEIGASAKNPRSYGLKCMRTARGKPPNVMPNGEVEGPDVHAGQAPQAHTVPSAGGAKQTTPHGPLQRLLDVQLRPRQLILSQLGEFTFIEPREKGP